MVGAGIAIIIITTTTNITAATLTNQDTSKKGQKWGKHFGLAYVDLMCWLRTPSKFPARPFTLTLTSLPLLLNSPMSLLLRRASCSLLCLSELSVLSLIPDLPWLTTWNIDGFP